MDDKNVDTSYTRSCWAFGAKTAIEGISKIKTGGVLVPPSAQQLLDCVSACDDCKGGRVSKAFSYVNANGGLAAASTYEYVGYKQACDNTIYPPAATITGFEYVPRRNELALQKAVAQQPVAISICGHQSKAFKLYSGGIFKGPCGTCVSHSVTIVGYGQYDPLDPDSDPSKYWLIKNSWGDDWGVDGLMYIQREAGPPEGLCGLALQPSYRTK